MTKKPKPLPDDPAQSARFLEAAKELGVDQTGTEFDRAFRILVPEKPHGEGATQAQRTTHPRAEGKL